MVEAGVFTKTHKKEWRIVLNDVEVLLAPNLSTFLKKCLKHEDRKEKGIALSGWQIIINYGPISCILTEWLNSLIPNIQVMIIQLLKNDRG